MSADTPLSRRSIVVGGTAAAIGTAMVITGRPGSAQESGRQVPATPIALGETMPPEITEYAGDWPLALGDLASTRTSTSSTISTDNVATLGPKWRIPLTTESGYGAMTGTPIVAGDTIYTHDMLGNVAALDRATGETRWSREYNVETQGPNGVALAYGRVFIGLGDSGECVCLDAATGEDVWRVTLKNNPAEGVLMVPTVYNNTVYVSTCPGTVAESWYDGGAKGILYALDASSGRTIWQWDTTTDNLWGNARENSGGGLWYPLSIDENGYLYFGVGNPAPWPGNENYPNGTSRPGENLYTNSMVALDPTTGAPLWYVQAKPYDRFDLDFQNTPILAETSIGGVPTKIAIGSGKTGDVIAATADTGDVVWWTKVGIHQNDLMQAIPDGVAVEVFPGVFGGVQVPPAFADDAVFVPVNNWSTWYTATGTDRTNATPLSAATGELVALNAADGSVRWRVELPSMPLGACLVANDVVFTAGLDGLVRAFSTADGTAVWEFQLTSGINAPLALAGDDLIVAAGGAWFPVEGQYGEGEQPQPMAELVCFNLGINGGVVPSAGPATTEGTPEAPEGTPIGDPAATPVAGADGSLSLSVEAIDIAFVEGRIEIPADTDVSITLVNTGALNHDLRIDEPPVYSGMLAGGEQATFVVNLPAGSYEYYCTVPGHLEAGMIGVLTAS